MNRWRIRSLRYYIKGKKFWEQKTKNQRRLLIGFAVLLVYAVVHLSWVWYQSRSLQIWQVIPDDAVFIVESNDIWNRSYRLSKLPIWQNLTQTSHFSSIHNRLDYLDSLLVSHQASIHEQLRNRNLYASVHISERRAFDYLFFIPLEKQEILFLPDKINAIAKAEALTTLERQYKDITIYELSDHKSDEKSAFTYLIYKNFLICSYTPMLVDEAIRKIMGKEAQPFFKRNKDLLELSKIDNDEANIYVNPRQIGSFMKLFAHESYEHFFEEWDEGVGASVLDLLIEPNQILLSGYTLYKDDYLALFEGQEPTPYIDLLQFVPKQTALFYRVGLSNKEKYFNALNTYWKDKYPEQTARREQLIENYNFSPTRFINTLGGEIALSVLEQAPGRATSDKILFLSIKDPDEALDMLKVLSDNAAAILQTSQNTSEVYQDWVLRRIDVRNFPQIMFGKMYMGFEQTYFTLINDRYLVFANSADALRTLINDIREEQVWAKLIRSSRFLEQTGTQANLSLVIDFPRYWNAILEQSHTELGKKLLKEKSQLIKLDFLALQMKHDKDKMQNNLLIAQKVSENPTQTNSKQSLNLLHSSTFQNELTSAPYSVRNHNDGSYEIFIQDKDNKVHLVSKDGKILWHKPVYGKMRPYLEQVDFYKNGKIQYLMTTPNHIYLIDRLGRPVKGFPIALPTGVLAQTLALIDYDGSKDYRFAISDLQGRAYLYNKNGQNLQGWNPLSLASPLSEPLKHLRIGQKDVLLAISQDGQIYNLQRNGNNYPNFPFDFDSNISSPTFLQEGKDLDDSYLVVMTDKGEHIHLSFQGKILAKKEFFRKTAKSRFSLVTDVLAQKNYLIARQDERELTIMTPEEQNLFALSFDNDAAKLVQYYNFGANIDVVEIHDTQNQKSYLYYTDGRLIGGQPIEASQPLNLRYIESEQYFIVHRALGKQLDCLRLQR
ncbi:MAG: DUF3352 domain-containing protein [Bernardetiaceae bacterium]|nr:DUF3352 domain-containing protein [Bernardetiaceae bacterium]